MRDIHQIKKISQWVIKRVPLFQRIHEERLARDQQLSIYERDDQQIVAVLCSSSIEIFQQGSTIFRNKDKAEKMYILFDGLIEIFCPPKFQEDLSDVISTKLVENGQIIGDLDLLLNTNRGNNAVCKRRSICLSIKKTVFDSHLLEFYQFFYNETVNYLFNLKVFDDISNKFGFIKSFIDTYSLQIRFRHGQIVFNEKNNPNYVYFIMSGTFLIKKVHKIEAENNQESLTNINKRGFEGTYNQTLQSIQSENDLNIYDQKIHHSYVNIYELQKGDFFGEEDILDNNSQRTFQVICVSTFGGELYQIRREVFERVFMKNYCIEQFFIQNLPIKKQIIQDKIKQHVKLTKKNMNDYIQSPTRLNTRHKEKESMLQQIPSNTMLNVRQSIIIGSTTNFNNNQFLSQYQSEPSFNQFQMEPKYNNQQKKTESPKHERNNDKYNNNFNSFYIHKVKNSDQQKDSPQNNQLNLRFSTPQQQNRIQHKINKSMSSMNDFLDYAQSQIQILHQQQNQPNQEQLNQQNEKDKKQQKNEQDDLKQNNEQKQNNFYNINQTQSISSNDLYFKMDHDANSKMKEKQTLQSIQQKMKQTFDFDMNNYIKEKLKVQKQIIQQKKKNLSSRKHNPQIPSNQFNKKFSGKKKFKPTVTKWTNSLNQQNDEMILQGEVSKNFQKNLRQICFKFGRSDLKSFKNSLKNNLKNSDFKKILNANFKGVKDFQPQIIGNQGRLKVIYDVASKINYIQRQESKDNNFNQIQNNMSDVMQLQRSPNNKELKEQITPSFDKEFNFNQSNLQSHLNTPVNNSQQNIIINDQTSTFQNNKQQQNIQIERKIQDNIQKEQNQVNKQIENKQLNNSQQNEQHSQIQNMQANPFIQNTTVSSKPQNIQTNSQIQNKQIKTLQSNIKTVHSVSNLKSLNTSQEINNKDTFQRQKANSLCQHVQINNKITSDDNCQDQKNIQQQQNLKKYQALSPISNIQTRQQGNNPYTIQTQNSLSTVQMRTHSQQSYTKDTQLSNTKENQNRSESSNKQQQFDINQFDQNLRDYKNEQLIQQNHMMNNLIIVNNENKDNMQNKQISVNNINTPQNQMNNVDGFSSSYNNYYRPQSNSYHFHSSYSCQNSPHVQKQEQIRKSYHSYNFYPLDALSMSQSDQNQSECNVSNKQRPLSQSKFRNTNVSQFLKLKENKIISQIEKSNEFKEKKQKNALFNMQRFLKQSNNPNTNQNNHSQNNIQNSLVTPISQQTPQNLKNIQNFKNQYITTPHRFKKISSQISLQSPINSLSNSQQQIQDSSFSQTNQKFHSKSGTKDNQNLSFNQQQSQNKYHFVTNFNPQKQSNIQYQLKRKLSNEQIKNYSNYSLFHQEKKQFTSSQNQSQLIKAMNSPNSQQQSQANVQQQNDKIQNQSNLKQYLNSQNDKDLSRQSSSSKIIIQDQQQFTPYLYQNSSTPQVFSPDLFQIPSNQTLIQSNNHKDNINIQESQQVNQTQKYNRLLQQMSANKSQSQNANKDIQQTQNETQNQKNDLNYTQSIQYSNTESHKEQPIIDQQQLKQKPKIIIQQQNQHQSEISIKDGQNKIEEEQRQDKQVDNQNQINNNVSFSQKNQGSSIFSEIYSPQQLFKTSFTNANKNQYSMILDQLSNQNIKVQDSITIVKHAYVNSSINNINEENISQDQIHTSNIPSSSQAPSNSQMASNSHMVSNSQMASASNSQIASISSPVLKTSQLTLTISPVLNCESNSFGTTKSSNFYPQDSLIELSQNLNSQSQLKSVSNSDIDSQNKINRSSIFHDSNDKIKTQEIQQLQKQITKQQQQYLDINNPNSLSYININQNDFDKFHSNDCSPSKQQLQSFLENSQQVPVAIPNQQISNKQFYQPLHRKSQNLQQQQ